MTNKDIKRELELIDDSLLDLYQITTQGEVKAIDINTFVKMISDRYSNLHQTVWSNLKMLESYSALMSEGPEKADQVFREMSNEKEEVQPQ